MSWKLLLKNNSGLDEVLNLTSKSKALKYKYSVKKLLLDSIKKGT